MFSESNLHHLLTSVATGETSINAALEKLKSLPFEQTASATLDHHRELRTGFPEVIFCSGKTTAQVAEIAERLAAKSDRLLGTRATPEQFEAAKQKVPDIQYHVSARAFWRSPPVTLSPCHPVTPSPLREGIVVVAAGTSDLPVADEAAVTLEVMGHRPHRITDVGVAGLHRILARVDELRKANVIIAVAGMEGALASVVAGLVATPVVAVPTSIGYGTQFGGVAALLAMLNSCASGLSVVNIDNGFGAACMAAAINNKCLNAATQDFTL
ncbi:MAG: nickel pincer cofactor biosynthesis protein LarB [Phycisphaerales bacterium]|nr:nickel pincer cofactor biosynthesis protein LarB [Phycisphaerales bacterium]